MIKNISLKTKSYKLQAHQGFGLLEILIASAIISTSLITLFGTAQITSRLAEESVERTQANFLAEEGVEVARLLRDTSWSLNIASTTPEVLYYANFNATTSMWALQTVTTPRIYDLFSRTIVFHAVYRRNSDGEIITADSPDQKTLDAGTRKVTARVFWGNAREIVLETYITNLFEN